MDTTSLKEYIFENDKIEYVLDQIGCHNIKYHSNKEYYSCGNCDGDNQAAVNVKNNKYLNVTNWSRPNEFEGSSDIFDLVQYNRKCSFVEAVKYLHDILGIEYTKYNKPINKDKNKFDPLNIFKRIKSTRRSVDVRDINVLKEEVLDEYIPLLQKNAEMEKKGEYETIGFVNSAYILQLSHNREYLMVLEHLLKKERR